MKLRTNLFERIKQHFVDDECDMHWWIDDDELEEFKKVHSDSFDSGEAKITDTREVSGKEWNNWWIGGVWGDFEGVIVNEDCPECGHLLVDPERENREGESLPKCRYCTDCDYMSDEFKKHREDDKKYWKELRNKPPEKKIKLEGETVIEFAKRVGIQMFKKTGYYIKSDNYWTKCTVCKREVPANDYYIGQDSGFAVITFSHEDCTNGGPCIGVPFKKETKKEWANLLGGH